MGDVELPPKEVHIYPDYGTTYAWDEEGSPIFLAPEWPDIAELSDIEEELVAWADTYDRERGHGRMGLSGGRRAGRNRPTHPAAART
jgi:hypothetical protein